MPRLNKRKPSTKQPEPNLLNAPKSTEPRTLQGKAHVALKGLKYGLHADPLGEGDVGPARGRRLVLQCGRYHKTFVTPVTDATRPVRETWRQSDS